tara:strand:+ start:1253 stop:1861 length:609 start_codon:yes stop_codon:yes gene_type:complete
MSLDKNSIVILNQYSFEDTEWPGHDLYESILVALKEKYSDRLVFRLHPEVHFDINQRHLTETKFNIKFAEKHNLKIVDGTERLSKFIRNNVDNIKAIYSIDSSGILISLKYNIPTYHLFGMFISNKIFHPFNKVYDSELFGWDRIQSPDYSKTQLKWEKSFHVKDNKLYLNITDLSQIGSIDDVVYDVNTKSGLKWEDLKWD